MSEKDFEILFRKYFDKLLNFAFNMVKDEEASRDIVQQVFLNFWNIRDKVKIKSSLQGYLYRSVYNSSINHIKYSARSVRVSNYSGYENNLLKNDEGQQIEEERLKLLQQSIDNLPAKRRAIFMLNRFNGMTYKEVAEHLGISVKMVEKQIAKSLKSLRADMLASGKKILIILVIYLFFMG